VHYPCINEGAHVTGRKEGRSPARDIHYHVTSNSFMNICLPPPTRIAIKQINNKSAEAARINPKKTSTKKKGEVKKEGEFAKLI
jgi:hypothetical protein